MMELLHVLYYIFDEKVKNIFHLIWSKSKYFDLIYSFFIYFYHILFSIYFRYE